MGAFCFLEPLSDLHATLGFYGTEFRNTSLDENLVVPKENSLLS